MAQQYTKNSRTSTQEVKGRVLIKMLKLNAVAAAASSFYSTATYFAVFNGVIINIISVVTQKKNL